MTRLFYSLLFLFVVQAVSVFGQEKLSVSATVTPLYVHTAYKNVYLYPNSDGQVVEPVFLNGAMGSVGYSAGVTVYYTYAPGWSVAGGLHYRYLPTRTDRLPLAGEGTTMVRSRAIRIPLSINYRSSTKKLSPYYTLAALVDFPFSSRVLAVRDDLPTQKLRLNADAGPVFNIMLGAGAVYQLNPTLALTAQPTITYRLGRFGGSHTENRTYELGLQTQLIYTF
ncbi:PorT family protein [Spirosoma sp. RP8]|uniref:PorT family protein n=1 Tax=Spirosoma liriopis TaxID=2937440 RepID=A0ABT0HP04_9BACT|nr:PorT family protein [Spirosoma liriopis]MCK8493597.1 PorT family protein [Spirosoma liriopis]